MAYPHRVTDLPVIELGQPKITQVVVTLTIVCPCPAKPTLLYVGALGGVVHCGCCQRLYRVDEVHVTPGPNGEQLIEIPLSIGRRDV